MNFDRFSWRLLLGLLLGLSLVRGVLYGVLIPPWQTPDEPKHFEYVRLLYEKRRLVREEDVSPEVQAEILSSMRVHDFWRYAGSVSKVPEVEVTSFYDMGWATELDRPPLPYLLYAPFYAIASRMSMTVQLYVLRFISTMMGALTVLIAFLTARELFPDSDFMMIGVPAFVIFLPMYTFLTGSVNSDNLAVLLVSALILSLVVGAKKGFTWQRILLVSLLAAGGLVTKRTTVFAIPLAVSLIPIELFARRHRIALSWRHVGVVVLVIGGVCLLGLAGFYLVQNGQILSENQLDGLQSEFEWVLSNYYADSSFRGSMGVLMNKDYFSLDFLGLLWLYATSLFKGFWANFGWAYIKFASVWYQVLAAVTLIAVGGLGSFGYKVVRGSRSLAGWQVKGVLILFLAVGLIVLQAVARQVSLSQHCPLCRPQGRYLLPAIVPIASLFVLGLREVVPLQYRKSWLWVVIGGLIGLDLLALVGYIMPYFYG